MTSADETARPVILVIEDEPEFRQLVRLVLERAGYNVTTAENGRLGMKAYYELAPALVITDILMPEKDGIEIMREIRRHDGTAKIIAMSGGGSSKYAGFLKTARQLGASDTIQKPFKPPDLVAMVRRVLNG